MNKRVKLITAVLLVAIILTLCACSAMDEKNNNIKEVVQKEGINEDIEKVLEIIDEERAEELYGRLKAEITSADANKEQSVLSLLGAGVSDQKTVVKVKNTRSGEDYVRFPLDNGGSIGYDEQLGIVNIDNFKRNGDIAHEKSSDAVIETISRDLKLEDYTVTENGIYQEGNYRIVWEKNIDGDAESNPYDSVWVLLDSETYQLLYLERYSLDVNTTTAKITAEDALKIAAPHLAKSKKGDGKEASKADIDITYVKEDSQAVLTYVIKNDYAKVIVDATTGKIISTAENTVAK